MEFAAGLHRESVRQKSDRRFTLLEMILAVALMGLLVTLLLGAGNAVTASWQRIGGERAEFAEVLRLDRTLDNALSNIVPFCWPQADAAEDAEPAGVFRGTPGQFDFVYRHRLNDLKDGALRFVRFQVSDGQLEMLYQERPLLDTEYLENVKRAVLAQRVDRIECLYADWSPESGLQWREEWNTETERRDPPLAVFVRVHWQDGRWESWLRRTAGNSQHERM